MMRRQFVNPALGACLLLLASCAAPPYDAQTDTLITQLQTDVANEFTALLTLNEQTAVLSREPDAASQQQLAKARQSASYCANAAAYGKIAVDIVLLQARIDGAPNWGSSKVSQSLPLLSAQLVGSISPLSSPSGTDTSVRATHQQEGILQSRYITIQYQIINAEIEQIQAFDVILKAGQSARSSLTTK